VGRPGLARGAPSWPAPPCGSLPWPVPPCDSLPWPVPPCDSLPWPVPPCDSLACRRAAPRWDPRAHPLERRRV